MIPLFAVGEEGRVIHLEHPGGPALPASYYRTLLAIMEENHGR